MVFEILNMITAQALFYCFSKKSVPLCWTAHLNHVYEKNFTSLSKSIESDAVVFNLGVVLESPID